MALTPISNSVEFVQDTVPTTAADGDSWLDTSLSPPRLKVFDDAVGGFIEPRSIQNLDAPVSAAGVDWSSKTPKFDGGTEFTASTGVDLVAVSGSGFLLSVSASGDPQDNHLRIDIDGTTVRDQDMADRSGAIDTGASNDHKAGLTTSPIYRFDSSFAVGTGSSMSGNQLSVGVYYVLD